MITIGPRNRVGPEGPKGPKGPQGSDGLAGLKGLPGPIPEHQWRGTEVRFKKPNGKWGTWVDLIGRTGLGMIGPEGPTGASDLSQAPKLVATFDTLAATAIGDLVVVTGANFVTTITDNSDTTVPNGIFGVVFTKPTTTEAEVMFTGIVGGYSGFSTGGAVSLQTDGTPGQSTPATGTIQQLGFAVSTTEIFVNLKQAIRRA